MGYPSLMFLGDEPAEKIRADVFEDLKLTLLLSPDAVGAMRPVCGADDIKARHELFRTLADPELRGRFTVLTRDAAELARLYDAYVEAGTDDERHLIYVGLLTAAAKFGRDAAVLGGGGAFLRRFGEFFRREIERPEYAQLEDDVREVLPHMEELSLATFKIAGEEMAITSQRRESFENRLRVCAENLGLPEFSAARRFSKTLPEDIVDAVAALHPEVFKYLDWFYEKYGEFFNEDIMIYRGEFAFYLELYEIITRLGEAGIPVTYPEITEEREFTVRDAYDITLLAKDESRIVPNDAEFGGDTPFYYLTGANGGGKTTYLRALGTAAVFFLNGCPVAGREARMCVLKNVFTHFPRDERFDSGGRFQNENDLVNEILEAEGGASMILLNETYSATSEELAVPLTVALAERLYKSGSFGVYITHQHGVDDTRIPFLNVVVDLSDQNRRTYKIRRQQGNLGSLALDILRKYRLDRDALAERFGGVR